MARVVHWAFWVALAALVAFGGTASAADYTWTGAATSYAEYFDTSANWSPNLPSDPYNFGSGGAVDNAIFTGDPASLPRTSANLGGFTHVINQLRYQSITGAGGFTIQDTNASGWIKVNQIIQDSGENVISATLLRNASFTGGAISGGRLSVTNPANTADLVDPLVGGTWTASGTGTLNVGGADGESAPIGGTTFQINGGTIELGNAPTISVGLFAGTYANNDPYVGPITDPTVVPYNGGIDPLGPTASEINATSPDAPGPWADTTTVIYAGQIYIENGETSFFESIDDKVRLFIDGNAVLNNDSYNTPTSSGALDLKPGWHDFDLRMSNGTGGYGRVGNLGFGWSPDGSAGSSTNAALYELPRNTDDMTADRFRYVVGTSGTVDYDSDVVVQSAGNLVVNVGTEALLNGLTVPGGQTLPVSGGGTVVFDQVKSDSTLSANSVSGSTLRVESDTTLQVLATSATETGLVGADIVLAGGTLSVGANTDAIQGVASFVDGSVTGNYFTQNPDVDALGATGYGPEQDGREAFSSADKLTYYFIDNGTGAPDVGLPTNGPLPLTQPFDFPPGNGADAPDDANPFESIGVAVGEDPGGVGVLEDNIVAVWEGTIHLDQDATLVFGLASDDGSGLFIKDDGGNWVTVVDNNAFQGIGNSRRTGRVTLGGGDHDVLMYYYERAGGAGLYFDTQVDQVVLDPAQPFDGYWPLETLEYDYGNDIFAEAGVASGLDLAPLQLDTQLGIVAHFGDLTHGDGASVFITGAGSGARLTTDSVALTGTLTINTNVPYEPGVVDDGGAAGRLIKAGSGDMLLAPGNSLVSGTVLEAHDGRLVGMKGAGGSSFDQAALELSGGEIVFAAAAGETSPVAYTNPLSGSGTLTAGKGGMAGTADGPMTIELGAAGATWTIPDGGRLRLRSTDGYTLDFKSDPVGNKAGNTTFAAPGGTVLVPGDVQAQTVNVNGANLTVPGAIDAGTVNVSAGSAAVAGDVAADANVNVSGGSLAVGGALSAGAGLTVSNGSLSVAGATNADTMAVSNGTANFAQGVTAATSLTVSGGAANFAQSVSAPALTVSNGTANLAQGATAGTFTQSGGDITTAANLDVTDATVSGGTINGIAPGENVLSVANSLTVNNVTFAATSPFTANTAGGTNLAAGNQLTVSGGTVSISAGGLSGGILGHWSGDSDFTDASGNGRNLTAGTGATTTTADSVFGGGAFQFAAGGAGATYNADSGAFLNGRDELTIALWVKRTDGAVSDMGIWEARDNGSQDQFGGRYDDAGGNGGGDNVFKYGMVFDTSPDVNEANDTYESANNSYSASPLWQFVAMTWQSGTGFKLYRGDQTLAVALDTPTDSMNTTQGLTAQANRFTIGDGAKNPLTGLMDEVWIFDTALDAAALELLRTVNSIAGAGITADTSDILLTADATLSASADVTLRDLVIDETASSLTLSGTGYSFRNVTTPVAAAISGKVTIRDTLDVGGDSIGQLTLTGDLKLENGAKYLADVGAGADLVAVSGKLNVGALPWEVVVSPKGLVSGQYTLFTYGTLTGFQLPVLSIEPGSAYAELIDLDNSSVGIGMKAIVLDVATIETQLWNGSGTAWDQAGSWDAAVPAADAAAVVANAATTATVTTAGQAAHTLIVDGGSVEVQSGGSLDVAANAHVLSTPGSQLVVNGGTMTAVVLNSAGTTTVESGGSLQVASANITDGTTTIESGGLLQATSASISGGVTSVSGAGSGLTTVGTLQIGDDGSLSVVSDATLTAPTVDSTGALEIQGAGVGTVQTLNVNGGTAVLSGSSIATLNQTGGDITVPAAGLSVDDAVISGGTIAGIGVGENAVTVANSLKVGNLTFDTTVPMTANTVGGTNPLAGGQLTLAGGTLTIDDGSAADILGRWTFDDVSGTTVINEGTMGALADGILGGDAVIATGYIGDGVSLSGAGYVDLGNAQIGDGQDLNFHISDWTISAWVQSTNTGTGDANKGTIVGNGGDTGGGIRYALIVSESTEGVVTIVVDDNNAAPGSSYNKVTGTGSDLVNDGPWHHVVGMRDGNELRVYVDGSLDTSATLPSNNGPYNLDGIEQHDAYIGAITNHTDGPLYKYFKGLIDEVWVFNGALSDEAVQSLMDNNAPPALQAEDTDLVVTVDTTVSINPFYSAARLGGLAVQGGAQATLDGPSAYSFDALSGSGSVVADQLTVRGTLAPGDSLGTLSVAGDVTMAASSLYAAEVQGTDSDSVVVSGTLAIEDGARLAINWLPGADASSKFGGTYTVAGYADHTGQFTVDPAAGNIGAAYIQDVVQDDTGVVVTLSGLVDGDANIDAVVDVLDYVVVSNNFGVGDNWRKGDVNMDGVVDVLDYVVISNNFGSTPSAGAALGLSAGSLDAAAVPEPGTLALLLCGALGILALLRRRR